MSLIITPSGGSAVTFSDMSVSPLWYATTGKYWQTTPKVRPWKHKILTQSSPGSAGRFVKRFAGSGSDGRDTRTIDRIVVHYVNTSIANVLAAYKADQEAVMNVANVLTLPGWSGTFPACECLEFELRESKRGIMVQKTGNVYRAQCTVVFEQLRSS